MTRTWKNLCLVMLLSMLQSIAPLVHAHVGGDFHPGGIHFHTGNIQLHLDDTLASQDHHSADQAVLEQIRPEFPAVGMSQGYKKEFFLLLADIPELSCAKPPHLPLITATPALTGRMQVIATPACCTLPPAQAPPLI